MNGIAFYVGACLVIASYGLIEARFQSKHGHQADDLEWNQFKLNFNKNYANSFEEQVRREIWQQNKIKIDQFNADESEKLGYKLGLNKFSDFSQAEVKRMNGYRTPSEERLKELRANSASIHKKLASKGGHLPAEVDWRKVPGRVSRVKDQGRCGSCWAFAAVGVLEGQEMIHVKGLNGSLIELSEQNIVDCVNDPPYDMGCDGGNVADALFWIKQEGGIDDASSYPYEGNDDGGCRFKKDKVVMTDTGASIVSEGNEDDLKEAVAKFGPVAVAIEATEFIVSYREGVYYDKYCDNGGKYLNHALLIVGYGTDPKYGDYWLLKNSWGDSWGEHGYIRMARNKNNMCGIASRATIPTFD